MKKFKFHLGKLLDYKEQNLDNERMVLAELNKELDQCQKHLMILQNKLLQKRSDYETALLGVIAPLTCQMHLYYIEAVKEEIKRAEEELSTIREKVENQIEVVKNLKLESRSLELIKEKQYQEHKEEENRENEKIMEEFVTTSNQMKKISKND